MSLYFQNKTPDPIQLVFSFFDPDCESEGNIKWRKKGWFHMMLDQKIKVWDGLENNKTFLFYAEDTNTFEKIWSGDRFTHIPSSRFDRCWNITGTDNGRTLGLRVFTATSDDYIVNLVPSYLL